jgi:hypothetical protein
MHKALCTGYSKWNVAWGMEDISQRGATLFLLVTKYYWGDLIKKKYMGGVV